MYLSMPGQWRLGLEGIRMMYAHPQDQLSASLSEFSLLRPWFPEGFQ